MHIQLLVLLAAPALATGTPVDVADLTDQGWWMDLSTSTIVEPRGIGPAFFQQLAFIRPVLGALDGPVFETAFGTGAGQEICEPTEALDAAFSNPSFAAADATVEIAIDLGAGSLTTVPVTEAQLTGRFAPGGTAITGLELLGSADSRHMAPDMGLADDEVCQLLGTFGVSCFPCASDGAVFCMAAHFIDIPAAAAGPFEARTDADIATDERCGYEPPDTGTDTPTTTDDSDDGGPVASEDPGCGCRTTRERWTSIAAVLTRRR